jgi:hypothetical protein
MMDRATVTMQEVRSVLDQEPPDGSRVIKFGWDALIHLENLISDADPRLSLRAICLASMVRGDRSAAIVLGAARSSRLEHRIAAALAVRNLAPADACCALLLLLRDKDIGVRKMALRSVPAGMSTELRKNIETMAASDQHPGIRALAQEVLQQPRPRPGRAKRPVKGPPSAITRRDTGRG